MLRFILWTLVIYFLWRVLRVLVPFLGSVLHSNERKMESPSSQNSPRPYVDFKDVKDADFKEIPKNPESEDGGTSTKNGGKPS
jgi:hypothetical protein